jgi:hypothetical protein
MADTGPIHATCTPDCRPIRKAPAQPNATPPTSDGARPYQFTTRVCRSSRPKRTTRRRDFQSRLRRRPLIPYGRNSRRCARRPVRSKRCDARQPLCSAPFLSRQSELVATGNETTVLRAGVCRTSGSRLTRPIRTALFIVASFIRPCSFAFIVSFVEMRVRPPGLTARGAQTLLGVGRAVVVDAQAVRLALSGGRCGR